MTPKAALIASLLVSLSSTASEFEAFAPWRGIKNSIFPSHDENARLYEQFWGVSSEPFICGLTIATEVASVQTPSKPPTNSVENSNADRLRQSLWSDAAVRQELNTPNSRGVIRRVEGGADFSKNKGQSWAKAKVGQRIERESAIRTLPDATIDLYLFENGHVLRVLPNTRIQFEGLGSRGIGFGRTPDTLIELREGRIMGRVETNFGERTYLIRTATALIRIRAAHFEARSDGTCIVAEGSAEVITPTHIHTVNAGEKYSPDHRPSRGQ